MSEGLKVLILGQDRTLMQTEGPVASDTLRRHIRYAALLRERLPASEIRVVTLSIEKKEVQPCPGLKIVGTGSAHRALFLLDLWLILRQFNREGWRPDIVTAQTPWEEALVGLIFARTRKVPFISQFHGEFFGDAFRRERLINRLLSRVSAVVAKHSDGLRVVSRRIRESILALGVTAPDRIFVVPVPVDFPALPRRPGDAHAAPPMVLFVGRLVASKDLSLWLEVASRVSRRLPEVRFVVAGDGPEKDRLKRRAQALDLQVQFMGAVDHRDLPGLFSSASVFLLTSTNEGLGRVIVESMLSCVPVVSVDVAGARELITDGVTGRMVTTRDADALADAVVNLLTCDEMATRMGTEAKRFAIAEYSFEPIARRLVDMWIRVAGRRP